ACIPEKLANRSTSHGSIELHRSWVSSRGSDNHGIRHRAVFFQGTYNVRNSGVLLTDGYINTEYRLTGIIKFFLVDDRIDTYSRFTGLTVTDYQFALTSANRDHRVNRFDTCLKRLVYRLTVNNARSLALNRHFIR